MSNPVTDAEREIIARELGRPPRALVAVAHRCPCGQPDVVETSPRLEDGTPFPTLYYLTCPRATAAASRLESAGRMREWQDELGTLLGKRRVKCSRRIEIRLLECTGAAAEGSYRTPIMNHRSAHTAPVYGSQSQHVAIA